MKTLINKSKNWSGVGYDREKGQEGWEGLPKMSESLRQVPRLKADAQKRDAKGKFVRT
jgi:hypothetical protein